MRLHCGAARATCLSKVELVCVGADVRLVKHDVVFALHHTTTGMRAAGIHLEGAGAAPQQNEELGGEGWQQMAGLGGHHPPGLCPQQIWCPHHQAPTWPVPAADTVALADAHALLTAVLGAGGAAGKRAARAFFTGAGGGASSSSLSSFFTTAPAGGGAPSSSSSFFTTAPERRQSKQS